MRPLDPRLLRYARSTRGFVALTVVLGTFSAVLVIGQAFLLANGIVGVVDGRGLAVGVVAALVAVVLARALTAWVIEASAYRTSTSAKAQLREAAVARVIELGATSTVRSAEVSTLVTRGIDALDGYYSRYLPQLVLAVLVPVAILVAVVVSDPLSAVIIAVTIPLIPVFMILIGLYTRTRVERQWHTLSALAERFVDLVAGLPTLKIFGRAKAQATLIRDLGDNYRSATLRVLRVSFLSSLVLELLASLSVALVAVSLGVRLAQGEVGFEVALFVLLLAPEAYLPLRLVGQHFHAAADGLGAAERIFDLVETPVSVRGGAVTDLGGGPISITLDAVAYAYPDHDVLALHPTTAHLAAGSLVAIVGPSGGGKSTLLKVLLRAADPTSGAVRVTAAGRIHQLPNIDVDVWARRVAWVPQAPTLFAPVAVPTVADIVRLGCPAASDDRVREVIAEVGLLDHIEALPAGLATPVDEHVGLSVGQQRRLAVARALITDADVLLLDEPSAALDSASEDAVLNALAAAAARGVLVLVVAHRAAVLRVATHVLHVGPADGVVAARSVSPITSASVSVQVPR